MNKKSLLLFLTAFSPITYSAVTKSGFQYNYVNTLTFSTPINTAETKIKTWSDMEGLSPNAYCNSSKCFMEVDFSGGAQGCWQKFNCAMNATYTFVDNEGNTLCNLKITWQYWARYDKPDAYSYTCYDYNISGVEGTLPQAPLCQANVTSATGGTCYRQSNGTEGQGGLKFEVVTTVTIPTAPSK